MALQLLYVGGRDPVRRLLLRSHSSIVVRLLQLLGRGPSKLLLLKSRIRRDFSTLRLLGRGHFRPLPRRRMEVT